MLEKSLESPLDSKEIKPVNPTGSQSWIFTDAKAETPVLWPPDAKKSTHWKRPWCWERLKAREGGDREWDGWMASPTQWMWVWIGSRSWWWTGGPGVLQSTCVDTTEQLNWTDITTHSWLVSHHLRSSAHISWDKCQEQSKRGARVTGHFLKDSLQLSALHAFCILSTLWEKYQ